MYSKHQLASLAGLVLAGLLLSACTSNGPGTGNGNGGGTGSSGGGGSSGASSSGGSSGAVAACTVPIISGATVKTATTATCLSCAVNNPNNVLSGDPKKFADISLQLSLLTGAAALQVKAAPGVTFPAGQIAGYTLSVPGAVLTASVIPQITISTSLNGTAQEAVTYTQLLSVDLLNLLTNNTPFFLGVKTTKAFDAVQVTAAPVVASALANLDVYNACSDATGVGVLAPIPGLPVPPLPIP